MTRKDYGDQTMRPLAYLEVSVVLNMLVLDIVKISMN